MINKLEFKTNVIYSYLPIVLVVVAITYFSFLGYQQTLSNNALVSDCLQADGIIITGNHYKCLITVAKSEVEVTKHVTTAHIWQDVIYLPERPIGESRQPNPTEVSND